MAATPFITLDEVKTYIDIQDGNISFDDKLTDLIAVSSQLISVYCRRDFKKQEYTEYFGTRFNQSCPYDLTGDPSNDSGLLKEYTLQRFKLKAFPVDLAQDFKVYYDTSREWLSSSLLIKDTDYYVDTETNAVVLLIGTVESPRSIKIVYTAGYTEASGTLSASLPEELKLACVAQTMFLFDKIETSSIGVSNQSDDEGQPYVGPQLLVREAQELSKSYRRQLYGKR